MMDVLVDALSLAKDESGGSIQITVNRLEIADDLPVIDLTVRHRTGLVNDARVFLCNRTAQGGGLKRQLDKVLGATAGKACFMLRASDFPPQKKSQTGQAYRKFVSAGGRPLIVPISEWERMMTVREFYTRHRRDPGFTQWFETAKLLTGVWCCRRCCASTC